MKKIFIPFYIALLGALTLIPLKGQRVNAFIFQKDLCKTNKFNARDLFKSKADSVVVISTGFAVGSGFVVLQDKYTTYIYRSKYNKDLPKYFTNNHKFIEKQVPAIIENKTKCSLKSIYFI
mgnify:CR=1 FL=1